MNAKEKFEKVKAFFLGETVIPAAPVAPVVTPVTPLALKSYKLQSGTEISINQAGETPAVGDTVTVGGAPAPAGDYVLEDKTVLVVDASGAITSVKPAEPVTTDLSNIPVQKTLEQRISDLEIKMITPATPAFAETLTLESQQAKESMEAFKKKIEKQDEVIKEMFELCEVLTKEPSADPKTINPARQERFEKMSKRDERLARMAEALKQNKALA